MSSTKLQPLIVLPQRVVETHGHVYGFDQQPAHQRVALFTDGSEPPSSAAELLARIQSEIAGDLSAAREARDRTDGEHKGQGSDRPDAGMGHEQNGIGPALRFFQNRAVQLGDGGIELVKQFQKFLSPPISQHGTQANALMTAGPRSQAQVEQFGPAFLREQLLLSAQALAHPQKVELISQHGTQANELMTVPEELTKIEEQLTRAVLAIC